MNLTSILRKPSADPSHSETERNLSLLAKRLGLSRSGCETVRALAIASEVPPVALLVSEHAFLVALAEFERAATLSRAPLTDQQRKAIAAARHELFAEP